MTFSEGDPVMLARPADVTCSWLCIMEEDHFKVGVYMKHGSVRMLESGRMWYVQHDMLDPVGGPW